MDGLFFDTEEIMGKPQDAQPSCGITCQRCETCQHRRLRRAATLKHGILFLQGAPTKAQDNSGEIFSGSYRMIKALCKKNNIDQHLISYAFGIGCFGTHTDKMRPAEYNLVLDSCHAPLMEFIESVDPAVIVTLDGTAWDALRGRELNGRMSKMSYNDYTFHQIPDQVFRRWLAPIMSPVQLLQMEDKRDMKDTYDFYARKMEEFFAELPALVKKPFPDYTYTEDLPVILTEEEEAIEALEDVLSKEPEYLAFDYETDALKVEREDLGIIVVGMTYEFEGNKTVVSFPFYKGNAEFENLWKRILKNKGIGKIAHHAKYEARVSLSKLGVLPEPWAWDSMYGAHVIDNRQPCGLKPQKYFNFGISGYDTMEKYMDPAKEDKEACGNNAQNSLRKACENPRKLNMLLQYVAQDSLYSYMLAMLQMEELKGTRLATGEKLLRSLINPLVQTECNGMVIDKSRLDENMALVDGKLEAAYRAVAENKDIKRVWDESKEGHAFDPNSTVDLGRLFYELLDEPVQKTAKGSYLLDADALEHMLNPVADVVLPVRKYSKIRNTYLKNIDRESVYDPTDGDYKMRSFFNLHIADTYRSSSTGGLNAQNIPEHDKEYKELIKSCIVPHKGMYIVGVDYKALEVTIGDSIHHDKNMYDFLVNGGDMHRATLLDTFLLTPEEADALPKDLYKEFRGYAKRENFCFFYGGGAKFMGNLLWKEVNRSPIVLNHLKNKGVGEYDLFMDHIKNVLERLWTVQFPQYGRWRKDIFKFYQKHGYVDLATGFRCRGPLTMMQASNCPIQGPAAHVALKACEMLTKELKARKMQSYIWCLIHDAIYFMTNDQELETLLGLIQECMIRRPREIFKWISAPLVGEVEASAYREEGGSWANETGIRTITADAITA